MKMDELARTERCVQFEAVRKDIPHDLLVPYLAFTQDDFEAALPKIKEGGVATHEYTQEDALAAIKANIK